ncbi:hypothetical protein JCM3765_000377 [Sporobolomyces pararoseus]
MSQPSFSNSFASTSHQSSSSSISPTSQPPHQSKPAEPTRAASPHSSASSQASTASSSSPSSSASSTNLMMSSVFSEEERERGRTSGKTLGRSAQGSVGSLATTVSPGTDAIKEEAMEEDGEEARGDEEGRKMDTEESDSKERRRRSASGNAINLSNLSIRQHEDDAAADTSRNSSMVLQEGSGRIRRASALSANSVVTPTPGEDREGSEEVTRSGKRKAARMGSFHAQTSSADTPTSTSASAPAPQPTPLNTTTESTIQPNTSPTSTNHVDIVSYPSNDLLRLLASLLEQIAQANDARNARFAAASAPPPPNPAPASPSINATPSGSAPSSLPSTRRNSLLNKSEDENFTRGRFDAAPLNSPVTPHHTRRSTKIGGVGGPGILDNAFDQSPQLSQAEQDDEMPLTPGVDLLREVGENGGVEGFMPSLGGTHQPMPLGRRRGSSFIRNKRPDEVTSRPSASRQSTSFSSFKQTSNASPSSSNESSPAPTRPSSTTPQQGPSPIPSPPNVPSSSSSPKPSEPPLTSLFSASSVALSSPNATLCFHARNVPAISIEAYLLRILKYCPTTNEVFLALLVYFDRMARIGLEAQRLGLPREGPVAGQDAEGEGANSASQASKLFAIDSFNVHRLVIAGVTVASKFFSDVFYTNSRYAKVGGLPLHELNQLELQFLLLNDFRLKVPTDELQRYADQLILFWIGRNGTSNPPAAAAAKAAASGASVPSSPHPQSGAYSAPSTSPQPSTSTAQSRVPTPTHAPPASRLTHSAVAAHHQTSSSSIPSSASGYHATHHGMSDEPRTPTVSTSTTRSQALNRPRSVRSQPSSSGTSVTSTITPGTPSTTRGGSSSDSEAADDDEDAGDARVRARGRFAGRGGKANRVEPSEDGHYHDGWSSNEASSRDSSAERDERDRREVDRKLDSMQED